MTTQLDPVIAATISQRRAEMQKAADMEEAQIAERELAERVENHAAWDALEFVLQVWQPNLYPYWQRPPDSEEAPRGIAQRVVFQAPELAPFCAYFTRFDEGWKQSGTRDGKYSVTHYSLGYEYEHSMARSINWRWWNSFNALPDTLVKAQDEYQNLLDLQAELASEKAERAAAQQERDLSEAVTEEHRAERAQRETIERQVLIDAIADDPFLVLMFKLHLAVQRERLEYQETIDNLTDQLTQTDEHYSERLTEARSESKANADRAYEAEIEASNARADAAIAARQLKQAQHG